MSRMECDAQDRNNSPILTVNDRQSILAMNQNGSEFIINNGDSSSSQMGGELSAFHAPQAVIFDRYANSSVDSSFSKQKRLYDQCSTADKSFVQCTARSEREEGECLPRGSERKLVGSPTSAKAVNIYGPCRICSDRATGKHYGAHSCDGCKGFFRRTVRKSHNYTCRFKNKCLIDRDKRNTCRHCRYAKCLNAGMKPEAVQTERDHIRCTRISADDRSSSRSPPHLVTTSPEDNVGRVSPQRPPAAIADKQCLPATTARRPLTVHRMCSDSALDMRARDDASSKGDTNLLIGQLMNAEFMAKQTTNNSSATHRTHGHAMVHCVHQTFGGQKATGSDLSNTTVRAQNQQKDKAETQEIGIEHQPIIASALSIDSETPTQLATTHCDARIINEANTGDQVNGTPVVSAGRPRNNSSGSSSSASSAEPRLASIHDLAEAIKQQLLLLVEWAKALPPFMELHMDDQIALLRAYSASHLLLGVARRSLPFRDVLLLSNDACIPRSHSSLLHDVNHVAFRVLDELVEPMRELQMNDTEYSCLKALLFFNPNAQGLSDRHSVKATRQNFLAVLQDYTLASTRAMLASQGRRCVDDVRFGNILLLSPPLQAMSQQFVEDLQLASLFGMATFDKLLEELLLSSSDYFSEPFLEDGADFNRKTGSGRK